MRTFVLRARAAPTDSVALLAQVGGDAHTEILAHTLMNAFFVAQAHRPDVVVYLVLESTRDFSRTLRFEVDAMHDIGGFDERYFMYMEDVDLGDRLGKAGWSNVFCPRAEIRHAQGHSASKHPEITVKAHHESAYRFMSDRLPGPALAPVRLALRLGLFLRGKVIIAVKKRRN